MAGVLGPPLVASVISPATKKGSSWVDIGAAASFSVGNPKRVDYVAFKKDGWVEEPTAKACWVLKKEDGQFVVYDPSCAHWDCPYTWHPGKNLFLCHCHEGAFDIDGKVVPRPPPRPLRRYSSRIVAGRLQVSDEVINS